VNAWLYAFLVLLGMFLAHYVWVACANWLGRTLALWRQERRRRAMLERLNTAALGDGGPISNDPIEPR